MMSLGSAAVVSGWSVIINNLFRSIRVMKDAAESPAHCAVAVANGGAKPSDERGLWIALDPHVVPTSRGPDRLRGKCELGYATTVYTAQRVTAGCTA